MIHIYIYDTRHTDTSRPFSSLRYSCIIGASTLFSWFSINSLYRLYSRLVGDEARRHSAIAAIEPLYSLTEHGKIY